MEDEIKLDTEIAGILLKKCISNSAGCHSTTQEEIEALLESDAGAIVTKSASRLSREGNTGDHKLFLWNGSSINNMGCPNQGYEYYFFEQQKKPVINSILASSIENLTFMLTHLNQNWKGEVKRLIEINVSCPNLGSKRIIGYDFSMLEKYIEIIDLFKLDNLIIGLKLPPYFQEYDFEQVSNILLKSKSIKFITTINTIPNGLVIDPVEESTVICYSKGGIGGKCCKPFALSNVRQFYLLLGDKIDIIGCGGINNGIDAFEHILCGAKAVQIGTSICKHGPSYFGKVIDQLKELMKDKKYKNIEQFRGKLKIKT